MNKAKICATCGTKYPIDYKRNRCLICEDDRQYIPLDGQQWTNDFELNKNHSVKIKQLKTDLYEFVIEPNFSIGQRALFVLSESGNILWDCIPMIDEELVHFINEKGGLKAITISHPHYYSNMGEWAEQFDCPIILPESEKSFVVNPTDRIQYWHEGGFDFWDEIKLIQIGGHFPGSGILYIPDISSEGAILCGDTFNLSLSLKHFSVMYSYPNRIPLPIAEVAEIKKKMKAISFDEIYGFWPYQNVTEDTKKILIESLERYT